MTMFTPHQRDILIRRVARAVLWSEVSRSSDHAWRARSAESIARAVVEELDVSGFSAATQRRAIETIADRLERSA